MYKKIGYLKTIPYIYNIKTIRMSALIRLQELETIMAKAIECLKKREEECINQNLSWDEYQRVTLNEREAFHAANREYRTLQTPIMEEIPLYGDMMTMEEFIHSVNSGEFIDYDGCGNYANEDKMSDIVVIPSDITSGVYRKDFTHIVWFNR